MTTLAQLNQTYQAARQWDRKIGHYMGADFLKDVDGVWYALCLAMRVVFAGAGAALLIAMAYAVLSIGNSNLYWIAQFGLGVGLFLIGRSIYPNRPAISFALMVEMAIVGVAGLGAGLYGIPALVTFNAVLAGYFPIVFSLLVSVMLFESLVAIVLSPLRETPEQQAKREARSAFRKVVRETYFTPEETRWWKRAKIISLAPVAPLTAIAFLLVLSGVQPFRSERWIAAIIALLIPLLWMIPWVAIQLRPYRAVLHRLQAAGLIERDEVLKVWRFKA